METGTSRAGARRPSGRRPGDSGAREAILDAALRLFAERGYRGATIRAIGAEAGVDPGLVRHYFRDKATLFADALAERTVIPDRIAAAVQGDPVGVGARIADTYLTLWEEPDTRPVLLALVRSAATDPSAARMLREVLVSRIDSLPRSPDSEHTHGTGADHEQRFALAGAHLLGIAFARHIVGLPAVANLDHDTLVAAVAPDLQRTLAGERSTAGDEGA